MRQPLARWRTRRSRLEAKSTCAYRRRPRPALQVGAGQGEDRAHDRARRCSRRRSRALDLAMTCSSPGRDRSPTAAEAGARRDRRSPAPARRAVASRLRPPAMYYGSFIDAMPRGSMETEGLGGCKSGIATSSPFDHRVATAKGGASVSRRTVQALQGTSREPEVTKTGEFSKCHKWENCSCHSQRRQTSVRRCPNAGPCGPYSSTARAPRYLSDRETISTMPAPDDTQ